MRHYYSQYTTRCLAVRQFSITHESVRAYVEINDPSSFWPRATRARLRRVDPQMYDYVERLFMTEFSRAA